MNAFKTEQEAFWHGEFGDEYANRNVGEKWIASNTALFAQILKQTQKVSSLIEFGSNIGLNLQALNHLLPEADLAAIEINPAAVEKLKALDLTTLKALYNESILTFSADKSWDLTLIKGVLIHINPEELGQVYERLYQYSNRYICIVEYYNPTPVEVSYRGHEGRLFKRDFAGEMLDRFKDLELVDYGFVYHRDNHFPQDDCTWFLLKKA